MESSYSSDDHEEWKNYKIKFNKKYKDEEEEEKMKTYFKNKELVKEHNAKYEKGEVSYQMAINKFSDQLPKK